MVRKFILCTVRMLGWHTDKRRLGQMATDFSFILFSNLWLSVLISVICVLSDEHRGVTSYFVRILYPDTP